MPKLDEYRRKRDFSKTPEPAPRDPDAAKRNLVFVIQQHAARRMHWDFRLEVDGVLKSWPLPKGPSLDPKEKRMAVMVEDHPYDYRNFEGVIPRGEYGAGQVIIWDEGIYTPDEDGVTSWNNKEEANRRMLEAIEKGKVSFTLLGKKLRGSFALIKTKYAPNSWLLIKHRDEQAAERDVLAEDASVRSGLTIADLKEGRIPSPVSASVEVHPNARAATFPDPRKERPMLATLIDAAFDGAGWLWEPKLDGVRALAYIKDDKVELRSRRGIDVTRQYRAIVGALSSQPLRSAVLDGEICALDEKGVPRFQLLQPRINLTRGGDVNRLDAEQPAVFFVFDVLYMDGYDVKAVPLKERRELLISRLATSDRVRLLTAIEEYGVAVSEGSVNLGFEGVVGKRVDSRYESGQRSRNWLKVKAVKEQEFVVGGYTPGEGARRSSFGALAIGYYDNGGALHWAGNVGSGFNDAELARMRGLLKEIETGESPFDERVPGVRFVRPQIVVQVKYAEWTKDNRLRAPVYLGRREDVDPRQVRREAPVSVATLRADTHAARPAGAIDTADSPSKADVTDVLAQLENPRSSFVLDVSGERIKLSNLDKEFWPEHQGRRALSKRDLISYYVKLAPVLLPHLQDRPLTLTRYPNGVLSRPFYQKHYEQPIPPFAETVDIWSESGGSKGEYILCNNLATLVWLAQLADLELHAWMARVDPEPDAHGRPLDFGSSDAALEASVLNYPDFMVFDLDPYIYSGKEAKGDEPEYNPRAWDKTVEVALHLKDLLDQLRLSSFVKTTGKTGLHVYVPILRHYDYDSIRAATQTIGRFLIQENPKDLTMEWDTSKRRGMVFFDANQNTRGKTLAAQYSLRPTLWAGVSTPVTWAELPSIDPISFTIESVPDRVREKGDLWADILKHKSDLSTLLGV